MGWPLTVEARSVPKRRSVVINRAQRSMNGGRNAEGQRFDEKTDRMFRLVRGVTGKLAPRCKITGWIIT